MALCRPLEERCPKLGWNREGPVPCHLPASFSQWGDSGKAFPEDFNDHVAVIEPRGNQGMGKLRQDPSYAGRDIVGELAETANKHPWLH